MTLCGHKTAGKTPVPPEYSSDLILLPFSNRWGVAYKLCSSGWESLIEPYCQRFKILGIDSLIIPCSRKKAEKSLGQKALNEAELGYLVP